MLKQTEYILTSFRETYKENFTECALEIAIFDQLEFLNNTDRIVSKDEKLMYQLIIKLEQDMDSDLFRGSYKKHFSSIPMFIMQLKKYQQSLFNWTTSLYQMNEKYEGNEQAIHKVFLCYLQTLKVIDQVVNGEEMRGEDKRTGLHEMELDLDRLRNRTHLKKMKFIFGLISLSILLIAFLFTVEYLDS